MQNEKKREKRGERRREEREREKGNTIYASDESIIESNREIIETKFTKISIAQQTDIHTYIHTYTHTGGKTRQNASPISRIERARVHNISHDPSYPSRFFVSGAILSRNEAR